MARIFQLTTEQLAATRRGLSLSVKKELPWLRRGSGLERVGDCEDDTPAMEYLLEGRVFEFPNGVARELPPLFINGYTPNPLVAVNHPGDRGHARTRRYFPFFKELKTLRDIIIEKLYDDKNEREAQKNSPQFRHVMAFLPRTPALQDLLESGKFWKTADDQPMTLDAAPRFYGAQQPLLSRT